MTDLPKILIFGQPFDDFSGGGITLSNLFRGWPTDKIASLWAPWDNSQSSDDICNIKYRIGREERFWKFPFNLYRKSFPPSGPDFPSNINSFPTERTKPGIKALVSSYIINPFFYWLGQFNRSSSITISAQMKSWLSTFNPDVLYFQVSTLEGIKFARHLIDYLRIPAIIHMMDDWPSTISMRGLFAKYWSRRINKEFMLLLDKVNLCLSISDAMSDEYLQRYNKRFVAFHNPVDLSSFIHKENVKKVNDNLFRVLYIGRIGTANKTSLEFFATTVSLMKKQDQAIELHIYTKDIEANDLAKLKGLSGIKVYPAVPHGSVPNLLAAYDLLLLPLDFNEDGLRFARLSIPTKASEYMISGTPVIVFAPSETAVSQFFEYHKCGLCVSENTSEALQKALSSLVSDVNLRIELSNNAFKIAEDRFDAIKVRERFRNMIRELV